MTYVTIAFRNIRKNLRKNLLTMLTFSFGTAALLVYDGSSAHMFSLLKNQVIHKQYGSFQIHKKGWSESAKKNPYDFLITGYSGLASALSAEPSIAYLAPRLHFTGILSGDDKSAVIRGFGGLAEAESKMEYGEVNAGSFIADGGSPEAVIGELALKKLSAGIGDRLTLLVSLRGGGISAADFEIRGTKKSSGGNDTENRMFILATLKDAQELTGLEDSVDTVLVHLVRDSSIKETEKFIARFCGSNGLEYTKWTDLAVFYKQVREIFTVNQYILTAILLSISVFIIVNTLYMRFMERLREIGTIRAIGTTKAQAAGILVSEGALLAAAGGLLGIAAGCAVASAVNLTGGIHHPASVFNDRPYLTLIQPQAAHVAACWLLFIAVSLCASAAISVRALQISIADSLRRN